MVNSQTLSPAQSPFQDDILVWEEIHEAGTGSPRQVMTPASSIPSRRLDHGSPISTVSSNVETVDSFISNGSSIALRRLADHFLVDTTQQHTLNSPDPMQPNNMSERARAESPSPSPRVRRY